MIIQPRFFLYPLLNTNVNLSFKIDQNAENAHYYERETDLLMFWEDLQQLGAIF